MLVGRPDVVEGNLFSLTVCSLSLLPVPLCTLLPILLLHIVERDSGREPLSHSRWNRSKSLPAVFLPSCRSLHHVHFLKAHNGIEGVWSTFVVSDNGRKVDMISSLGRDCEAVGETMPRENRNTSFNLNLRKVIGQSWV